MCVHVLHIFSITPQTNLCSYECPTLFSLTSIRILIGELTDQNVLIVKGSLEKTAEHFKLSKADTEQVLSQCREKLAQARLQRPKTTS